MTKQQDNALKSFTRKNPWIIIPAILVMGYILFTQINDMMAQKEEKDRWNNEDTKVMVDQCLRDSKDMAVKYPEPTKEYCECSTKKFRQQ